MGPAYLLLCVTSRACVGGSCGTEGGGVTGATPEGGWAGSRGALTKRGGQGLLAEDLLVQLLSLLVLVLFQVGRGLRGGQGQGQGAAIWFRPGNVSDLAAAFPAPCLS